MSSLTSGIVCQALQDAHSESTREMCLTLTEMCLCTRTSNPVSSSANEHKVYLNCKVFVSLWIAQRLIKRLANIAYMAQRSQAHLTSWLKSTQDKRRVERE